MYSVPPSLPPQPPPSPFQKKNDGIKIILERLKQDQKFNAYGGSRRVQSKTQQKLIRGKICKTDKKDNKQLSERQMLTNNKQKTRKKNKNKITKLPMKHLTNWFIDS